MWGQRRARGRVELIFDLPEMFYIHPIKRAQRGSPRQRGPGCLEHHSSTVLAASESVSDVKIAVLDVVDDDERLTFDCFGQTLHAGK